MVTETITPAHDALLDWCRSEQRKGRLLAMRYGFGPHAGRMIVVDIGKWNAPILYVGDTWDDIWQQVQGSLVATGPGS